MGRLQDKVVFITGAGSGIGRVSAALFAKEGAKIVIAELNSTLGEASAKHVRDQGGDATFVETDVTKEPSVKAAVEAAVKTYGRLDVLFNCAGGSSANDAPVTEVDMSLWDHTMNLDVLGTFLSCRHGIPELIKSGGGTVINFATWGAMRGALPKHIYISAKGAIISLTRALAGEYAKDNIRVNAISPGVVRTERSVARHENPETRIGIDRPPKEVREQLLKTYPFSIGEPIDIANIALFLACGESRMITGTIIQADGGRSSY